MKGVKGGWVMTWYEQRRFGTLRALGGGRVFAHTCEACQCLPNISCQIDLAHLLGPPLELLGLVHEIAADLGDVVKLLPPVQNFLDVFLHDALDIGKVLVEFRSVGAGGRVEVILHLQRTDGGGAKQRAKG